MPKITKILERDLRFDMLQAIDRYVAHVAAQAVAAPSETPPRLCAKRTGRRSDEPFYSPLLDHLHFATAPLSVPQAASLLGLSPARARRIAKELAARGQVRYDRGQISLFAAGANGQRMGRPPKVGAYAASVAQFLSLHPGEPQTTADILAATGIPAGTWPTVRRLMQANSQIVRHDGKNDRDVRFSLPTAGTPDMTD